MEKEKLIKQFEKKNGLITMRFKEEILEFIAASILIRLKDTDDTDEMFNCLDLYRELANIIHLN